MVRWSHMVKIKITIQFKTHHFHQLECHGGLQTKLRSNTLKWTPLVRVGLERCKSVHINFYFSLLQTCGVRIDVIPSFVFQKHNLLITYVFTEHLLCSRQHARCWDTKLNKGKHPCPHEAYILVGAWEVSEDTIRLSVNSIRKFVRGALEKQCGEKAAQVCRGRREGGRLQFQTE